MSRVVAIRVLLENRNTRECEVGHIEGFRGLNNISIFWGDAPNKNNPVAKEIVPSEWLVCTVSALFETGTTLDEYYHGDDQTAKAWRYIRRCVNSKRFFDEHLRQQGLKPNNFTREGRKLVGTKSNHVLEEEKREVHPAIAEINKRYTSRTNAVAIFPGSWLDNKLQEAYYSRRTKGKDSS